MSTLSSPVDEIVIVGAGVAGVSAAFTLRRNGFSGRLHLIDSEPHLPYERPPLSKGLHDSAAVLHHPLYPLSAYEDAGIELHLGTTVVELDRSTRSVVLDTGDRIDAGRVLLTLGAHPRTLDIPGAGLSNVTTLRTLDDATALRTQLTSTGSTVVIGGGFIGLEAAASARMLGGQVTVIEAGDVPLGNTLGSTVARRITDLHRSHGVEIRTGMSVVRYLGSDAVEAVELASGEVLPATTVIVGVGVTANDDLARDSGINCAAGIVVDKYGQTDDPWVFAAGDVALQDHPSLPHRGRIEHWDNAIKQGVATANTILGAREPYGEIPYFWSDQFDAKIQMYGRPSPDDRLLIREYPDSTAFLALWMRGQTIVAGLGMNCPPEVRAVKSLIELRIPVSPLDLTSPDVNLRRLVRTSAPAHA